LRNDGVRELVQVVAFGRLLAPSVCGGGAHEASGLVSVAGNESFEIRSSTLAHWEDAKINGIDVPVGDVVVYVVSVDDELQTVSERLSDNALDIDELRCVSGESKKCCCVSHIKRVPHEAC